jgi:hypothetical protein
MSQEPTTISLPPPLSVRKAWLAALIRPSIANYEALGRLPSASVRRAYGWMFASGLIGGAIDSSGPLISELVERSYVDMLLLALIPVSSIIAMCYLAAFAGGAQGIARLFKGSGTYRQLVFVFAAFSAPLLIVASLLNLISLTRVLLIVLYIYWLGLYVVAVRAVNRLSRVKAIAAVLVALLILGFAWLGVAFLAGYWGLLLP